MGVSWDRICTPWQRSWPANMPVIPAGSSWNSGRFRDSERRISVNVCQQVAQTIPAPRSREVNVLDEECSAFDEECSAFDQVYQQKLAGFAGTAGMVIFDRGPAWPACYPGDAR